MTFDNITEIPRIEKGRDGGEEYGQFYTDVMLGLRSEPKSLPSKYFYDAKGDRLFQEIMQCGDYYLARCEMEVFKLRSVDMVNMLTELRTPFHLIELGPGDCTKSSHLLLALMEKEADFIYVPIDISENVIDDLKATLPEKIVGLKMEPQIGDYLEMLEFGEFNKDLRKVVLCLGGNIGNMSPEDTHAFGIKLRKSLNKGDLCIIGFDLKKDPSTIQRAYDDSEGITSAFNLNLLERMNRELGADFQIGNFKHYSNYDPQTGASRSYLVCLKDVVVNFPSTSITFKKYESIWTEISQKYTLSETEEMAIRSGFKPTGHFMDSKGWFTDAIWVAD